MTCHQQDTESPSAVELICPVWSNSCHALGTDDWLGIVTIRIHRPSNRKVLTTLNDCDPPHTCTTASVRPWVGRTPPSSRGSQSI